MDVGLFILRAVIGALFIGHGAQKLFGWFGGHGIEGTSGFFESLGYRPGRGMAVIAGSAEAGGGALLLLGFLTPAAAAVIVAMMINAMGSVHAPNGVWNTEGGIEFPLVMATSAAALGFTGPGAWSLDAAMGSPYADDAWGWLALAAGILAGVLGLRSREVLERTQVLPTTEDERYAA